MSIEITRHFKNVFLVLPFTLSAGCGMYNFQPKAEVFGGLVGTDITDLRLSASLMEYAPGDCVEFKLETLSALGKPLMVRDTTAFRLAGFRTNEVFYTDASCQVPAAGEDLKVQANTVSKTLYIKSSSAGSYSLEVLFGGILKKSLPMVVRAMPRNLRLQVPVGTLTVPAGYCSGPYELQLLDNFANPVPPGRYQVQVTQGQSVIFQDNCNTALASPLVTITNDNKFTFYLRKNSITRVPEKMAFSTADPLAAGDERMLNFESVPHRLRIVDGPADDTVSLGVCQAAPYAVELLDVEGNPVAPKPLTTLTVSLRFLAGTGQFLTACGGQQSPQLVFNSSETRKQFFLMARARNAVTIEAASSPLISATRSATVVAVPLRISSSAIPAVVAGSIGGPITITLLDGLDFPIAAPAGGFGVNLTGPYTSIADLCSTADCSSLVRNSISIPAGSPNVSFYVRPSPNLENRNDTLALVPQNTAIPQVILNLETPSAVTCSLENFRRPRFA